MEQASYGRVVIVRGDITTMQVDAIVNAANATLTGGGGVDGAIHKAAGPGLLEECRKLGGCKTGEAKITQGYNLPSKFVIHVVGPIWRGGGHGEAELLARCYKSAFTLADEFLVRSLAFPSVSTGAYNYPVDRAALIAMREIRAGLLRNPRIEKVYVVCFDMFTYSTYIKIAERE